MREERLEKDEPTTTTSSSSSSTRGEVTMMEKRSGCNEVSEENMNTIFSEKAAPESAAKKMLSVQMQLLAVVVKDSSPSSCTLV